MSEGLACETATLIAYVPLFLCWLTDTRSHLCSQPIGNDMLYHRKAQCMWMYIIIIMASKYFNNSGHTLFHFIIPSLGSLHLRWFDFRGHDSILNIALVWICKRGKFRCDCYLLKTWKVSISSRRCSFISLNMFTRVSCYHRNVVYRSSMRRSVHRIREYPEVTMEGRNDKRVYELDLHGKKLAKIEGLEKVWSFP